MGFLMSTDALVCSELPDNSTLLDAHERQALKAGAKFRYYGHTCCNVLIGSVTTRGYLTTVIHHDGRIEHAWDYNN